jgi:hypothetical protein
MRGRKARAQRRSQENTRLSRKAATVERDAHEQEFDRLLAEARTERADAMKAANKVFEKKLKALEKDRREAVQAADQAYIEKRDAIVKRLAGEQAAAA